MTPYLTAALFALIPIAGHVCLLVGSNKPSRDQLDWLRRLRQRGYRVEVVCDEPQRVIEIIDEYLGDA